MVTSLIWLGCSLFNACFCIKSRHNIDYWNDEARKWDERMILDRAEQATWGRVNNHPSIQQMNTILDAMNEDGKKHAEKCARGSRYWSWYFGTFSIIALVVGLSGLFL